MESTYHEVIILGNMSTLAWSYLEAHGAQVEEKEGLVFLRLPRGAEMSFWRYNENSLATHWEINFPDEDAEDKPYQVVLASELLAIDTRCYLLSL